jgi:peptidoglycan/xylan/chitin deacetylase (PgdA/CDA1 family)
MAGWIRRAPRFVVLPLLLIVAGLLPPGPPSRAVASAPAPVVADEDVHEIFVDSGRDEEVWAPPTPPTTAEHIRPTPTPAIATWRAGGTFVPILLYHYIRYPIPGDPQGFGLSVTPPMFHQQMQYLAANGYHVLSLHDAVQAVLGTERLPSRPVVLTFDDGYEDFFTAAVPELRQWGFTATSFVITGRVGSPSYMSWFEIQAADAMGFTIGAHTVHHVMLASLAPAQARWEMQQSRDTLAAVLGHPILDFAYPYGSFNSYDMAAAKDLGFECAVATVGSPWHWRDELFYMNRLRIGGGFAMYDFARWLGGPPYRPGVTARRPRPPPPPPPPPPTPTPTATAPIPTPTPAIGPVPTPTPTATP